MLAEGFLNQLLPFFRLLAIFGARNQLSFVFGEVQKHWPLDFNQDAVDAPQGVLVRCYLWVVQIVGSWMILILVARSMWLTKTHFKTIEKWQAER